MIRTTKIQLPCLILCVLFKTPVVAQTALSGNQTKFGETTQVSHDGQQINIVKSQLAEMEISATGAPLPALKHKLYPSQSSFRKGDAATLYHRAILFLRQQESRKDARKNKELADKGERVPFANRTMFELTDLLPKKLSPSELEELKKVVEAQGMTVFSQIKTATHLEECDWGFDVNEGRPLAEYISFLLPEMQEFRSLARFLAIRAKVQIDTGDFEGAIETLRCGFRMSKTTENTRFLVCSLIGIACSQVMLDQVEQLIKAEDSPNLYWALQVMPDPLVSVNQAFAYELEFLRNGAGIEFLKEPEKKNLSAKQWNLRFAKEMKGITSLTATQQLGPPQSSGMAQVFALAQALRSYPIAKKELIELGMDREQLEEMPAIQVIAIHESRMLKIIADEILKCQNLDIEVAKKHIQSIVKSLQLNQDNPNSESIRYRELIPIASTLLPAVTAVMDAEARIKRRLKLYQTVEAVRMHAAEEGALPETLSVVKVVPVPDNPDTGQPFIYRKTENGGILWEMDPELATKNANFLRSKVIRIKLRK